MLPVSTKYRLAPDDQADLRWVLNDAEAECGVRSNLGAVIDRLSAAAPTDDTRREAREWEEYTTDSRILAPAFMHVHGGDTAGRIVDAMPDRAEAGRRRAQRIRDTLVALLAQDGGSRHATVLNLVYGPKHRRYAYGRLGDELAPLVEMTAAVVRRAEERGVTWAVAAEYGLRDSEFVARVRAQCEGLLGAASKAYERARAVAERESGRLRAARVA